MSRAFCGNRIVEPPELCDNGQICMENRNQRCLSNEQCYTRATCVDGGILCAGQKCCKATTTTCVSDLDCPTFYSGPCVWSDLPNPICTSKCTLQLQSAASSEPPSSSSVAPLSSALLLSSAASSFSSNGVVCGNGILEAGEECDGGGTCTNRYGLCRINADCAPIRGVCVDFTCKSLDPSVISRPCQNHEQCWGAPGTCKITVDLLCSAVCKRLQPPPSSSSVLSSSAPSSAAFHLPQGICTGLECWMGGRLHCGKENATCRPIAAFPCIECLGGEMHFSSSSEPLPSSSNASSSPPSHSSAPMEVSIIIEKVLVCGNGDLEEGEQCDDGNLLIGDGCSDICVIEPLLITHPAACGDGVLDQGEACDDGNVFESDGCSASCSVEIAAPPPPRCGDGVLDMGEACDDGELNNAFVPDRCRADCSLPRCGDGVRDSGEECDDGNVLVADGCSESCRREPPPPPPEVASVVYDLPFPEMAPPLPIPISSPSTGPAAVALMAAGASAGVAWMRRRKKKI